MTSGIEMEDVIKTTGFPVPEDMVGKTFAEVVEGGGSGEITVEALTATENKVYTAPEGKAYSPVTVNVPTSQTAYAWKVSASGTNIEYRYYNFATSPADRTEFNSKKAIRFYNDADSLKYLEIETNGADSYTKTSDTVFDIESDGDELTCTRDSTKDITLW